MGNLRACLAVAMLAFAACGSDHAKPDAAIVLIDSPVPDAKVWEDAPPAPTYDFSCTSNPAPTTATATITLSGSAQQVGIDLSSFQPTITSLEDATVEACKAGAEDCADENSYGTATTAADGAFEIGPIETDEMPLDVYLALSKTGSRTLYTYPPQPLVADFSGIPLLTFSPVVISVLGQLPIGCTQNDQNNGMLLLAYTDCANTPIGYTQNLTISIQQNGSEVQGTQVLSLGDLAQELAGTFVVCNVPENATTTVGGTYDSTTLRAHDVKVVKGTITATIVRPGF